MNSPLNRKKRIAIVEMNVDKYSMSRGKIGEGITRDVQGILHTPEYYERVKGCPTYKDAYLKEDINSAIRFFLRYKDTNGYMILEKEFPEIALLSDQLVTENEYNEWLIKYCFGCVMVEQNN